MAIPYLASPDLFGQVPDVIHENGGPAHAIGSTLEGRYAEFMVCAWLSRAGYEVRHMDTTGFDIALTFKGHTYRIDVKSTGQLNKRNRTTVSWKFTTGSKGRKVNSLKHIPTPSRTDILALYYRITDTVVYLPVLKPITRATFSVKQMKNSGDGLPSLLAALATVDASRS